MRRKRKPQEPDGRTVENACKHLRLDMTPEQVLGCPDNEWLELFGFVELDIAAGIATEEHAMHIWEWLSERRAEHRRAHGKIRAAHLRLVG
jgi:hypothetical protein